MEIITVSGTPPDDPNSPEYLAWHEHEFVLRGNMVVNQSSSIEALQAHVKSLERRCAELILAARDLVKAPKPLELVEDKNEAELSDRAATMEEEEAALEIPQPVVEEECAAPQDEGRVDLAEDKPF